MEGNTTVTLNIDLQDGFEGDTVKLEINDKEVFKEDNITTDLRTALAKHFSTNISNGEVSVKVSITAKDLTGNYKFMIESEAYLGIRIIEPELTRKEIKFSLSKKPFVYF